MLDVKALIKRAYADPAMRAQAGAIAARLVDEALRSDHARTPGKLRGSDAGACVRAVWADVHGKLDVPEDVEVQLAKMLPGTLLGATYAALFKVAVETDPHLHVELEEKVEADEISITIDAVVYRDDNENANLVVEFKSTFGPGSAISPHVPYKSDKNGHARKFQVYQAVNYAQHVGAPRAVVFTVFPGSFDERFDESHYQVDDWAEETQADFARLSAALGDAMPKGDPREGWRCKSCRFGACEDNQNPLRAIA